MREACLQCDLSSCGYKTGCIAVKSGKIIAKGYNETLKGEIYCQNNRCYREEHQLSGGKEIEKVCSIHAEASVIAQAARDGLSLKGSDLYVSTFPCIICSRAIVKAGFRKVFYMSDYGGNEGVALFEANGVGWVHLLEREVWFRQVKSSK